ncbi:hypothetical protein [Aquicella lusitana]|uniref:Uncharacterized protein n=1 Tax=Aquicella lusitana TaxID=254246 RepID=A0A370GJG7_9COXI|nr:hypothetical protein [Aquicella lusitana]RDI42544.1 hypothetical protein C8D86_11413 [Aquicella lusitana]VVC74323.1 hypothetical protein AQULUS_20880 [Aquicella lusitana]
MDPKYQNDQDKREIPVKKDPREIDREKAKNDKHRHEKGHVPEDQR